MAALDGRVYHGAHEVDVALRTLARRVPALKAALQRYGPPPFWQRRPGFASLAHIVLEQQVSLASAAAVSARVRRACGRRITAAALQRLGADGLGACGVTRPKQRSLLALSEACRAGTLNLRRLAALSDMQAMAALTAVHGIGPWTANIYLLVALCRTDVWPANDVALLKAMQTVLGLPQVPTAAQGEVLASRWAPHRSAVARLLYHVRLSDTGRQWVP